MNVDSLKVLLSRAVFGETVVMETIQTFIDENGNLACKFLTKIFSFVDDDENNLHVAIMAGLLLKNILREQKGRLLWLGLPDDLREEIIALCVRYVGDERQSKQIRHVATVLVANVTAIEIGEQRERGLALFDALCAMADDASGACERRVAALNALQYVCESGQELDESRRRRALAAVVLGLEDVEKRDILMGAACEALGAVVQSAGLLVVDEFHERICHGLQLRVFQDLKSPWLATAFRAVAALGVDGESFRGWLEFVAPLVLFYVGLGVNEFGHYVEGDRDEDLQIAYLDLLLDSVEAVLKTSDLSSFAGTCVAEMTSNFDSIASMLMIQWIEGECIDSVASMVMFDCLQALTKYSDHVLEMALSLHRDTETFEEGEGDPTQSVQLFGLILHASEEAITASLSRVVSTTLEEIANADNNEMIAVASRVLDCVCGAQSNRIARLPLGSDFSRTVCVALQRDVDVITNALFCSSIEALAGAYSAWDEQLEHFFELFPALIRTAERAGTNAHLREGADAAQLVLKQQVMRLVLELAIIFNHLPAYVLLEIVDWLPGASHLQHHVKVEKIIAVRKQTQKLRLRVD